MAERQDPNQRRHDRNREIELVNHYRRERAQRLAEASAVRVERVRVYTQTTFLSPLDGSCPPGHRFRRVDQPQPVVRFERVRVYLGAPERVRANRSRQLEQRFTQRSHRPIEIEQIMLDNSPPRDNHQQQIRDPEAPGFGLEHLMRVIYPPRDDRQ